jgi:hypothetical protein
MGWKVCSGNPESTGGLLLFSGQKQTCLFKGDQWLTFSSQSISNPTVSPKLGDFFIRFFPFQLD